MLSIRTGIFQHLSLKICFKILAKKYKNKKKEPRVHSMDIMCLYFKIYQQKYGCIFHIETNTIIQHIIII